MNARADALAAIERIVDRGGDADDVLRNVLATLQARGVPYAAIRFEEAGALVDGPTVGEHPEGVTVPVLFEGSRVGELKVAVDDAGFADQVAALISPYVLVGWDTSGEPWEP